MERLVIKLKGGLPTGNPLLLSNVRYLVSELSPSSDEFITATELESYGYGLFQPTTAPEVTDVTKEYINALPVDQNEDGAWMQNWVLTDRTFADEAERSQVIKSANTEALIEATKTLKDSFDKTSKRPKVNVTLADESVITVDGGYKDLQNFQIGKDLGLLKLIDINGNSKDIVADDYDAIFTAIKTKGLSLMQIKWDAKDLLNSIDLTSETAKADIESVVAETVFA